MGSPGDRELALDLKTEVERVAKRLRCAEGEWTLEFRLRDGSLVGTWRHHGPIRNVELARLAEEGGAG